MKRTLETIKADNKKIVVHDVGVWLARTKTWLYSEVTQVGDAWEPWVVANRTANLSEFPFVNLFSLRDRYGYPRWFLEMVMYRLGLCTQCPKINEFVRSLKPAVVHSHFGPVGWRNLQLVASIGARHVVSFYGTDVTRVPRSHVWQRKYRELFKKSDAVLCEGPCMVSAIQRLGCPQQKIHLYHLGVNLDSIPFKAPTWQRGKPLRILMASTFTEKKGLPYGLAAIARLKKRCPELRIRATLVGGANKSRASQREKRVIYDVINEGGIRGVVSMKGSCSHDEFLQLATEHDVFLSPSILAKDGDSEGGAPVAVIEMAAAGLVVVSTKHCDIPYVLGARNREILVNERDSDALSDALNWLVDRPGQWPLIAKENRRRIEQEYNLENQGPALAKIYEMIV